MIRSYRSPTYEQIIAERQQAEDEHARADQRPSKVQGWAYRWRETCPCCQHQFTIEIDSSEGFSRWERRGKYETDCPNCYAELEYPFEVDYVISLGRRELVKAGDVPDPEDGGQGEQPE